MNDYFIDPSPRRSTFNNTKYLVLILIFNTSNYHTAATFASNVKLEIVWNHNQSEVEHLSM